MRLSHYTEQSFTLDRSRSYDQERRRGFKPDGLWLSVDGEYGWPEWCNDESFYLEALAHRTQYRLTDSARILQITNGTELVEFARQYGRADPIIHSRSAVDWAAVAAEHDGILISPYRRADAWDMEARHDLDLLWHSGWDCSSGCVWNLDALAEVGE